MRCNRCTKGSLIEIRMTVAGADLTFRRCGRCENQVWECVDGPLPLDHGAGARPRDVAVAVRWRGRLTPAPYRPAWQASLGMATATPVLDAPDRARS